MGFEGKQTSGSWCKDLGATRIPWAKEGMGIVEGTGRGEVPFRGIARQRRLCGGGHLGRGNGNGKGTGTKKSGRGAGLTWIRLYDGAFSCVKCIVNAPGPPTTISTPRSRESSAEEVRVYGSLSSSVYVCGWRWMDGCVYVCVDMHEWGWEGEGVLCIVCMYVNLCVCAHA